MTCRRTLLVLIVLTWCGIAAAVLHRRYVRASRSLDFQAAAAGLYHVIPQLDLRDVPLDEALDTIAMVGNVKLNVGWRSLAGLGIGSTQRVTLKMEGYTVERVLDVLIATLERGSEVGFEPRGAEVLLTNRDQLPAVVRVYDVRDLVSGGFFRPFPGYGQMSVANTLFANQGQVRNDPLYDAEFRAALDSRLLRVDDRYGHSHAAELMRQCRRIWLNRQSHFVKEGSHA